MVGIAAVHTSNARIATDLPAGLVAVFVGGTSGIGEYTLKALAKHARQPRLYFVGRSQEAGDRIAAECKTLNADGQFHFIKADTSLIRTVDDVCNDIKSKESAINLLVLSTGTLVAGQESSEGLHIAAALVTYSRNRFIANLLPCLQKASGLRRVLTIFAATKEGAINTSDMQGWKLPLMQQRGHAASIVTVSLEALAKQAPDVAFVHDFPGPVTSGIGRGTTGVMFGVMKFAFWALMPLIGTPPAESGERHLYFATSARYAPKDGGMETAGVPLEGGDALARGTTGKAGSGVYSIDSDGESAGPKVEALLAGFRKDGTVDKVWELMETEWTRATSSKAA